MAEAFITRRGGGGAKRFQPVFSGQSNIVMSENTKSGYVEFFTSGVLTWTNDEVPPAIDLFCVGGGGGGGNAILESYSCYSGGGGGGGYTTTVLDGVLPSTCDIMIGAGGNANTGGGQTYIGSVCVANGGGTARQVPYYTGGPSYPCGGGDGGSAGGNGGRFAFSTAQPSDGNGGDGGSNGGPPSNSGTMSTGYPGTSQGTPTTDLLGRVHAGGGGGGSGGYKNTWNKDVIKRPGIGGTSNFSSGKGEDVTRYDYASNVNKTVTGGGGYGGGGAGAMNTRSSGSSPGPNLAAAPGGQGFAMIGWGDYISLYNSGGNIYDDVPVVVPVL